MHAVASAVQRSKATRSLSTLRSTRVHCGKPLSDPDLSSIEPNSASPSRAALPACTRSARLCAAAGRTAGLENAKQKSVAKAVMKPRRVK